MPMKQRLALVILLACSCDRSQPEGRPQEAERADSPRSRESRVESRPSGEQARDARELEAAGIQDHRAPETAHDPAASPSPQVAAARSSESDRESGEPRPTAATPDTMPESARAHAVAEGTFRVTPGQRFEGTATLLKRQGSDGVLRVVVEQAPPAAPYLTLLRAASCAPVGVNLQAKPAPQPSTTLPAHGDVIGRMELARRGPTELSLPTSIPGLIGSAVVAYAPVVAHGGDVLEPVACTVLAAK
jgi:hypothetical protein